MTRYTYIACLQALFLLLGASFMTSSQAAVNDVVPGDYYPPADGITALSVYAFHADHDGPYVNGAKVLDGNITSYLRYRYRPDLHFHVGGQVNGGGKTRIDGVESDAAKNTRATLGTTLFLPEGRQLILRYAKDLDIDTGYKNHGEFLLRYQVVF